MTRQRILWMVSGLVGGTAVALLSLSPSRPALLIAFNALIGALAGIAGVYGYMHSLVRLVHDRRISGGVLLAILVVTLTTGGFAGYWLSGGEVLPSAVGVAALLCPTTRWLYSRDGLVGAAVQATRIVGIAARTLVPMLVAGVTGVPVGLIAWMLPVMAAFTVEVGFPAHAIVWKLPITALDLPALILAGVLMGVLIGCGVSAAIGLMVGRTLALILRRFTAEGEEGRRQCSAACILGCAMLTGIVSQLVIVLFLWIDPPSSIQGPGPFMPPFAIAAAIAALLADRCHFCRRQGVWAVKIPGHREGRDGDNRD